MGRGIPQITNYKSTDWVYLDVDPLGGSPSTRATPISNLFGRIPLGVNVGIGVAPPEAALHVLSLTDNQAIVHVTALFQNTGEVVGGQDLQNEVHIRLQAGTTTDHRRYINFAGFDGQDDWVTGVNAGKNWILYDTISPGHRLQLSTGAAANTHIMAAGTGSVRINEAFAGEASGTGGLAVYDGAAPSLILHAFDANYTHYKAGVATGTLINNDGQLTLLGALDTNYSLTVNGVSTQTAAPSSGGINISTVYTPSAASTSSHIGITTNPSCTGLEDLTELMGASINPYAISTGSITNVTGARYYIDIDGPDVTSARGALMAVRNLGPSTIDTAYGIYIAAAANSGGGVISANYGIRILDQTVGVTNTGIRSGITAGANKYNLYLDGTAVNWIVGRTGFNAQAPLAQVHIDQSVSDAAIPVLILDQADLSEGFVNHIGTTAASAVGPISSWTTGNTIQGFVRTEINGAAYWMPYYDAPTS